MAIHSEVAHLLNQQINNELHASYTYLAMAAFFDAEDLPGFAAWFRAHSQEETGHAMRIYDFIVQRGAAVALKGIEEPRSRYDSPREVVDIALSMEKDVTSQIHRIFEKSHEVKEFGTQNMLHWFLDEQVQEEDLFRRLLDQVTAAGENRWYLTQLDRELGARK